MDRLFLAGLVREIDERVRGRRVRDVVLPAPLTLCLRLQAKTSLAIVCRVDTSPALFVDESGSISRGTSEREKKLSKLLSSATVSGVEADPLDRVATIRLSKTRLSGRKRSFSIVVEFFAVSKAIHFLDAETKRIVDAVTPGRGREAVGALYVRDRLTLMTQSAAATVVEFVDRLRSVKGTLHARALMEASGWTPLLSRELHHLLEAEGASLESAFNDVERRLRERQPALYTEDGKLVLSPIPLRSKASATRAKTSGFNDAMVRAAGLAQRAQRLHELRQKVGRPITKRLKQLKTLDRKLRAQQAKLEEPSSWRRRGETLLAGLSSAVRIGEDRVEIPDPFDANGARVELVIDPRYDLQTNAERMFRKSKKAARTQTELAKRREDVSQQLDHAESFALALDDATTVAELDQLLEEAESEGLVRTAERGRKPRPVERSGPREFRTSRGNLILVGRSARSNEELTFRIAKPTDLWLHAANWPGSHVVIRSEARGELAEDEILRAAELAAYFSKARNERGVDVWIAERRHVSKIKGAPPGLVTVADVRTVRVTPVAPASDTTVTG